MHADSRVDSAVWSNAFMPVVHRSEVKKCANPDRRVNGFNMSSKKHELLRIKVLKYNKQQVLFS